MFDKVKEESHKIDQHVKLKAIFIFSSFHGLISPPTISRSLAVLWKGKAFVQTEADFCV